MNSKRMGFSLALALFALVAVTANAFADFDDIYMVGSLGSTDFKDTFGWDETPWLYLKLPSAGWNVTGSWWTDPDDEYSFEGSSPSTAMEQWLTLSDWATARKIGDWNVYAIYFYAADGSSGTGSTGFEVVPEPVSTILFLTGGALFGGRLLLRRRRK